ncbi:glycosyltransferase [Rhizobium metallidurans]|uniref:Glycosyltransferase n=1 Tax=Rhizobium metallidurans TaxID=1265931 RepID=A0A7W6GDJ9_9HYPH|nr:glycosyltransferase family 4 protein [Rhizobium metallidurans]MBB3967272.1 hypothetical protein [Rhizobium metallidurans]
MFDRYQNFTDLSARIDAQIRRHRFDTALHLIQEFVETVISEPMLVSHIYGSKELDRRCQELGLISYRSLGAIAQPRNDGKNMHGCNVYIVSKLQTSGGHTKVIKDFIAARPNEQHAILSTELAGVSELGAVNSSLSNGKFTSFHAVPGGNHWKRLRWLQTKLLEMSPKRVYLFNHHQDSVAVAAVVPEMRIPTTFYHHGDHHLCLGVFLSDVEHIDPHPMGFCNCRKALKIQNTFVPLVVEDRRSIRAGFMENGYLTTCTAARLNKIEIPYYVNYLDVVPELLREGVGRHIHIGRLTPWALYRLRRRLRKYGVEQNRFVYIPWVASVWDALVEHKVDLYVASFPYGGGLTLIEAMGAGIPVVLHRHMYSRILSGISLGYPTAFNWHWKDDLIEHCKNLKRDALSAESKQSRRHYVQFHRTEVLADILNNECVDSMVPSTEADDVVETDTDELAQWLLNNMTFTNIFCQRSFRVLKRIRRRLIRANSSVSERIRMLKVVR